MVDISQLIASAKAKVGKVAQKFDRDQSMPGFQFAQGGLGNQLQQRGIIGFGTPSLGYQVKPAQQFVSSALKPAVDAFSTFGRTSFDSLINQPIRNRQLQTDTQKAIDASNRALQTAKAAREAGRPDLAAQYTRSMINPLQAQSQRAQDQTNLSKQKQKELVGSGVRTALYASAIANPLASLSAGTLSTGLGAAFAGQTSPEQLGTSFGEGFKYGGMPNPVVKGGLLAKSAVGGIVNLAEDALYAKTVENRKLTPKEIALSLALPAAFETMGSLKKAIKVKPKVDVTTTPEGLTYNKKGQLFDPISGQFAKSTEEARIAVQHVKDFIAAGGKPVRTQTRLIETAPNKWVDEQDLQTFDSTLDTPKVSVEPTNKFTPKGTPGKITGKEEYAMELASKRGVITEANDPSIQNILALNPQLKEETTRALEAYNADVRKGIPEGDIFTRIEGSYGSLFRNKIEEIVQAKKESLIPDLPEPSKPLSVEPVGGDLLAEAKKYKSAEEFAKNLTTDTVGGQNAIKMNVPVSDLKHEALTKAMVDDTNIKYNATPGKKVTTPIEAEFNVADGTWRVSDGQHRLSQAVLNGDQTIPAKVKIVDRKFNKNSYGTNTSIISEKDLLANPTEFYNQSKGVAQGGLSDASSPKGIRTGQEMANDLTGKTELGTPLLGGRSIRTKASSGVSSTPIISNKGKLNLERLAVDDKAKQALQDINNGISTSVISNKSVIEKAKMVKGKNKPMSDEQMQNLLAQQLKNRQEVVDLSAKFSKAKADGASEAELGKIMLELSNQSRTAQQGGTFAGRLLQAQNIVADQSATPMQKILALLDNAGVKQEKYLKDSVKVDWENPTEVVKFYRKYVPPKLGEVITEIRYTNMLSSPLTHITNIASNALQTGVVTPIEKTVTGLLDAVRSSITGKERQYYASAGINYTKGYLKSLPDAWQKAKNIMNQTETTIRPDMEYMPTGVGGPLQAYTTPLRALEAMDQFFKTLVQGGVTKELQTGPRKMSQTKVASQAAKESDYRLFRQAFDPNGELGQGGVLQMFDKWNSAINGLRRLPGGKWVLPFLQTPTNILKQGVEYSPLGVITAPGSKAPLEQLSKALIGTGVYATAYQLASSGLTSWEAPSGEKERSLYYAAGMQPYSIKMGDKWVSFSKLGPLSYPIAMAAALADAEKKNPDKTKTENIAKSISGMLGFFGDQSYVRSIGDLVDAIQGGVNVGPSAISGQASNLAGQLIPYKSFQTWLGRIIDPTYRKAQTFTEKLTKDLPILGSKLEPYTDLQGNPSQRDLPLLNSISPYKVTQEKSSNIPVYEQYQQNRIKTQQINRAKEKIKSGQEVDSIGGVYLNMDGGTVDVGKVASMPSTTGYDKVKKEEATFKIIDDVMKLPVDQQEDALKKLGVSQDDAQYYTVAKSSVEAKTAYVMDGLEKMISQGATRDQALNTLLKMRNEVNGQQIASDNVLKELYDQNIISKQDYNNLKQVKVSGGQIKRKQVGRAKKAKAPEYNYKALMKPTKVARRGKVKIKRIKI